MKFYILVMKGHEISERYYDRLYRQLQQINGIEVLRWDAVTPETLHNFNSINFTEKWPSPPRNYSVGFTETEKAVWYSHMTFWEHVMKTNEPAFLFEHDIVVYDEQVWIIEELLCNVVQGLDFCSLTMNILEAYYLSPKLAKKLINFLKKDKLNILENVDSYMLHFADLFQDEFNIDCLKNQILYSKPSFGKTIIHEKH